MKRPLSWKPTLAACYLGYVTQAIALNLPPLLFVTFQREYGISLDRLGLLITVNFVVQIVVDLLASRFGDLVRFRPCAVAAHVSAVAGFAFLCFLPERMSDPFAALMIATVLLSVGGGLIEVMVTPIVDALPPEAGGRSLSLLHSFYCWGCLAVVVFSTAFFAVFGTENWRILVLLWALVPLLTLFLFLAVRLPASKAETTGGMPLKALFGKRVFWVLILLMICSGATELSLSQWASLFAEAGLGVAKSTGDLLGPCLFALLMGVARLLFVRADTGDKLCRSLLWCGAGCVAGYLLIVLSPWPMLSLVGFGVCGFSVGLLWPGVLSLAADTYPKAGTAMFAALAVGGDIGCSLGPGLVGLVSAARQSGGAEVLFSMKGGFAAATVFPLLMVAGAALLCRRRSDKHE